MQDGMTEWTEKQLRVIRSDAREIICSAAAGSGKTAVMVERIIRLLREGAEPDSFLIMTFTNAAASEMRERIRERLIRESGNPNIRSALDQMDLMQISTIHSFCQQLLKNQFQLAEIDPDFQICDASQRMKLFHASFQEACEEAEAKNEAEFKLLKSRYESKKTEEILLALEPFLMSLPDPLDWLDQAIANIPSGRDPDHPWFRAMAEMAGDQLGFAELSLNRMYRMFSENFALEAYRETWKADAELFHVKQSVLREHPETNTPSVFTRLKTAKGLTVQESDWKERYQKLREKFKKNLQELDECLWTDEEKTSAEWNNMKESLRAIQDILVRTETIFQEKKRSLSLLEFHDLEQYAVKVLSDPAGREEAQSVWRWVFVDECQDISAVQNRIVRLLQSPENHLFMVGDVKQSIYRFRLADPILFLDRIRECAEYPGEDRECIFLQSNFRSRPEILETTNLVFQSVMRESVAEITYGPEERLIPGRKTEGRDPVQAVILRKGEEKRAPLEAEADFLQAEIRNLLAEEYPGKGRKYQYRDCVILMPATQTDGPRLAALLEEREIPVFFDGTGDYFQRQEIHVIRNLLEWIDDPLQDLPLISVLENAPFFFSEEELSQIRLRHAAREIPFWEAFQRVSEEKTPLGEKCAEVRNKLRDWQRLSETMHVSELIWELYHDTGIYYLFGAEPTGQVMQANLRMLAQQAAEGESRGILTLRQFLGYMRDQQSFGDRQSATLLGDQDNLVRIMTVHKSKGLQFPVVFCLGMDKSPVRSDSGEIRYHASLGLCVNYKDPEHRISRPTPAEKIFAWKKSREEAAEKIRVLYVAMTRAQEKLYLLTCQETNPLWSAPEGDGRVLSAESYTDWWMPALLEGDPSKLSTGYAQPGKPYEIRIFEGNQQKIVDNEKNIHNWENWLESVVSAPVVNDLWKKEDRDRGNQTLIKKSVTALIQSARNAMEEMPEETAELKRTPDLLKRKLQLTEMPETPEFMRREGRITASWRGVMTHRVLSLMSLESMRSGMSPEEAAREEKKRMAREHMASEEELRQVNEKRIGAFWRSEMGRRVLASPEVHREWNFNLLIERKEKMILQGIIDCAFREEEGWVILDYKTDRGKTTEEMREEYRPQLLWYARAIRELTGLPVREAALYSLERGELIPVYPAETPTKCDENEPDSYPQGGEVENGEF